jgi:hypothetical protein
VLIYEGVWPWTPEFEELTPVSHMNVKKFDVSTHLSRSKDAGLLYRGFVDIPVSGKWTFYATSDAGTHLRIHESQVIDDDLNHDGSEANGTILLKAGLHPFKLYYRTVDTTPELNMMWSGPGYEKQLIPETSIFRAVGY